MPPPYEPYASGRHHEIPELVGKSSHIHQFYSKNVKDKTNQINVSDFLFFFFLEVTKKTQYITKLGKTTTTINGINEPKVKCTQQPK